MTATEQILKTETRAMVSLYLSVGCKVEITAKELNLSVEVVQLIEDEIEKAKPKLDEEPEEWWEDEFEEDDEEM